MGDLPHAGRFKELLVYKKAHRTSQTIFQISKGFPKEEAYSLTDQIRRSSRSIGAQIAEAWGKRRYINHFISKLTDADAEVQETQHWILVALSCSYVVPAHAEELDAELSEIGRMLHSMMQKSGSFCHSPYPVATDH